MVNLEMGTRGYISVAPLSLPHANGWVFGVVCQFLTFFPGLSVQCQHTRKTREQRAVEIPAKCRTHRALTGFSLKTIYIDFV